MKTKAWSPAISFVMFGITATTLASAAVDWHRQPYQRNSMRLLTSAGGGLPVRNRQMGKRGTIAQSASAVPLPGVYKTAPYAGIVVVPDKYPDDLIVVAPAENGSAMPTITPDLRFAPLRSK